MTIVGLRIHERRIALNLTQERLADLIKTSQKQVSRYESGINDPTGEVIFGLAQALHTSADYLLGITDDPSPPDASELGPKERQALAAWRRGDLLEAAKIILNG